MCFLSTLSLLLVVVSWDHVFAHAVTPMTIQDYVNFRATETRNLLLDVYAQYNTDDAEYEVGKWKHLWSRAASSQPRAINLDDQVLIIDERQVFSVALNLDEANNISAARDAAQRQLNLASPNQPIEFIKSYLRSGLSLLLVCRMSYCTHYRALNASTFDNQQLIEYPGFRAIDAAFFTHAQHPHLVIAYDESASKIYRWNGTRMVEIHEIFVGPIKSVVTFSSGQSTIILFTIEANADASPRGACVIYELNHQSLLRQIKSSTNMDAATSIYPYNYAQQQFFLTINRMGLAEILLWNGSGFAKLITLSDVEPFDQIRIAQIDNETLLFISDLSALHIFKIKDEQVVFMNNLVLLNKQRIVEITVWKYENNIMLLLIKMNSDGTFQTELWQMNLHVEQSDVEKYTNVRACFRELQDALNARAAAIKNFQIAQSRDLSNLNNSSETFPLHLDDLIINDVNIISVVEFRNKANTRVASPQHVKEKLIELKEIMSVLTDDVNKNAATLWGNVSVGGDAYFDELFIDNLEVDYVNGELADFESYLISGIHQQFSEALNVRKASIDDLSVSSLCGYGFDNWMQVNDSVRSDLKNANTSSIVNDTIVIESELIMTELNTKNMNGIELSSFLDAVFIIGKNQVVRGEVRYDGIVQVMKLYSDKVNNVSSSDLITKPSNQSLNHVFIDTLQVEQLYVEKINGVPIDKAARMSRENVIRGKVTLSNLIITDELTVNENIAIPLTHSTQVYDQIHIDGHVFIKNLELEPHTSVNVSGSELDIRNLVRDSWGKSSHQIIPGPTAFEKGAAIDRLSCPFLNGLGEQDFLYTDSSELSHLENVTFGNFHFNSVMGESSGSAESFIRESSDFVTFLKPVGVRYLSADNVLTDKYNGIPIESIMRPKDSLEFPDDFEFETIRADGGMSVDDLGANRLNRRSSATFEKALRIDHNLTRNSSSAGNVINLSNANVSKLNGRDLERSLAAQQSLPISLTIEGKVTIGGGVMHVHAINNEKTSGYIGRLRNADPLDLISSSTSLTIVENLEVALLNGRQVKEFFAASLSKTRRQTLAVQVTLADARINYLTADAINNSDLSKLMYADQPAVLYGSVSFSNLYVAGHVKSKTFNGSSASEYERKLHRMLPINGIDSLLVQGDVKWDKPSSHSLARLLDNAVTKHEHQFIDSCSTFDKPVVVESLYLGGPEISQKIREIISDTVFDNAHPSAVGGTKTFKRGLTIGNLWVDGNIDISRVNGLDIREISSQILRKDKAQVASANVTFLLEVEIGRLLTGNNIHGVSLRQLAVVGQTMPNKLYFQNLVVHGDVSLYKLDGVDFDDFIKRRVTTDVENKVLVDVEFLNTVRVSNGTFVTSVNDIIPENFVQSNADGAPIVIHGNKVFYSKLDIEHSLETPIINNFTVDSIYDNAILNGTNAHVLGSLVFESKVETLGNITLSGKINGLPLQRFREEKYLQNRLALNTLSKDISLLGNYSLSGNRNNGKKHAKASVLYLEEEKNLKWHFAGVQSIKNPPVKHKTRLEIITTEKYALCGLKNDCSCRKQYIVDILPSGEYEIQEQNTNNVTWTFYRSDGMYGLKIFSESASYSEQCSKTIDVHENSKIFWFKFNGNQEILRRTPALVINDYISDAQIFQVAGQLYLIMTIFYSKETASHATNSLLYQFDFKNGKAVLVQTIPTNGAKTIELFQITNVGMHVLIGCVKGKAESLLARFNPSTRQFQMMRAFATGGSKYVASVSSNDKSFVILDNPDVRGLQIFDYDEHHDNFVDYQNIFLESRVVSLGVFYSGDFGHSDAFVVTTTRDGWLYIHEYMFYGKFQLKMSHWVDDIQVATPFRLKNENYLFVGLKFNSTVYKVIQQGYY